MPRASLALLSLLALVFVVFASPAATQAEAQKWVITEFAGHGVDPSTVATFRGLLRDEIQQRNHAAFADIGVACPDSGCALSSATGTGADVVVYGSVGKLGEKLSVSVRASELASGRTVFSQSLSVDRPEELDIAAKRLADALVSGEDVADNAEVGTVTHEEARAPARRDTRVGFLFGFHGVVPFTGYAEEQLGVGTTLGAFIEAYDFVIEPTLGFRFDLTDQSEAWTHLPLDIAFAYVFSRGDVAPFLGGGLGLHVLFERVHMQRTVGDVLRSTSKDVVDDTLVGASFFPRAGFLFMRTYDVSLELVVEYPLTLADFEQRSSESALRFGMNLVIGGS